MHLHDPIHAGRVIRHLEERIVPAQTSPGVVLTVEYHPLTDDDGRRQGIEGAGEPVPVAHARTARFRPIEVGTSWGPPWGTTWFRLSGTVPTELRDRHLEAVLDLGWSARMPGFQGEALVYRPDGTVLKGLNPLNTWIPVEPDALGEDGTFEVYVEAASNPILLDQPAFLPTERGALDTTDDEHLYVLRRAAIDVVHDDVRELVADLRTLGGLATVLPTDSGRQASLRVTLDRALDALDLDDVQGTAAAAREVLAPALAAPAAASAHRLTAVGHAHIDSAWLWPLRETRRKVARTIANVLHLQESGEDLVFAFPAAQHASWLEEDHPDLFARLRDAVREGRVVPVGGMWVESDANLPGGEAMVRQFVEGAAFYAEAFDHACREVWLPDSFGYSPAMPQLARLAGAEWFLTQKLSWNQVDDFPHHSFWWEGIDGTRIFTHFPPADTYTSDLSAAELDHAATTFRDKGLSRHSLVPFGWGDGGGGPSREMLAQARRTADLEGSPQVRVGAPSDFHDAVVAEAADYATWVGELYLELHRATYTTQARIKRANRESEHLLREAELWATTAAVRGLVEYPHDLLRRCWRRVLLGQFHDILPGTSISWVYTDVLEHHAQVARDLDALIGTCQEALAGDGEQVIVFNAAPRARVGVPALGAAAPVTPSTDPPTVTREGASVVLEDAALRVVLDADGLVVSLLDKAVDREVVPPGQRGNLLQVHQDFPNKWDAWDVDPFYRNRVEDLDVADAIEVEQDEEAGTASVLVRRSRQGRPIVQTLTLRRGEPGLHARVQVDWKERDRFLKLAWPVDVHTDHARFEVQMGHATRPTHTNTSWDFHRFEVFAHRWVHVGEPGYGVGLANEATYGYDLTRHQREGGGTFHLLRASLLRGPAYPDPRTDHGTHEFAFTVLPGAGVEETVAAGYAANLLTRARRGSGVPPLVTVGEGAVVEAVKSAQDRSGDVIVRLYEPYGRRAQVPVTASFLLEGVVETDLHERPLSTHTPVPPSAVTTTSDTGCVLALRPFQVVTLRLRQSASPG